VFTTAQVIGGIAVVMLTQISIAAGFAWWLRGQIEGTKDFARELVTGRFDKLDTATDNLTLRVVKLELVGGHAQPATPSEFSPAVASAHG
jgi:hypothetical protein